MIDDLGLNACDLLMLDTEGYEFNALRGGIETIKKYMPVICVEMFPYWLARYNSSAEEIEKLLFGLGYKYMESYKSDRIYIPS
jgi:hypothetical protein